MNVIHTSSASVTLQYNHLGYYPYSHILLLIDVCGAILFVLAEVSKECNTDNITFTVDTTNIKTGAYKTKLYYSDGLIDLSPSKYIQEVTLNVLKKTC